MFAMWAAFLLFAVRGWVRDVLMLASAAAWDALRVQPLV